MVTNEGKYYPMKCGYSPSGEQFYVSNAYALTINFWNANTCEKLGTVSLATEGLEPMSTTRLQTDKIEGCCYSPDSKLVFVTIKNCISLWDTKLFSCVQKIETNVHVSKKINFTNFSSWDLVIGHSIATL